MSYENISNYAQQGGSGWVVGGTLTVPGTLNVTGTLQTGGVTTDRLVKCARVALGAADTGGGILAWANPEDRS